MAIEDEKTTEPNIPVAGNMRFARAGYEGYARFTGGKTFDGRQMPSFDVLELRIKEAWAAAAMAIIVEQGRVDE